MSETARITSMSWLIRITPTPLALIARITSRTTRVCRTPSAAVGSSRITICASVPSAREIATACCCPPESRRTGVDTSTSRMLRRASRSTAIAAALSSALIARSGASRAPCSPLPGRYSLDVEVPAQREVLEDRAHPRLPDGAWVSGGEWTPVQRDLARIGHESAGQHLNDGRLACPVVADERDHLPGCDIEADVSHRPNGAERARQVAALQDGDLGRCRAGPGRRGIRCERPCQDGRVDIGSGTAVSVVGRRTLPCLAGPSGSGRCRA